MGGRAFGTLCDKLRDKYEAGPRRHLLPRVQMGRAHTPYLGETRENDGLETGSIGGYGREISGGAGKTSGDLAFLAPAVPSRTAPPNSDVSYRTSARAAAASAPGLLVRKSQNRLLILWARRRVCVSVE